MAVRYQFPKKTIRDIDVHGKRILLRADFNVPMDEKGNITSDYRIVQTIPTITYLLERGCEVVIMTHLGRPGGKQVASDSLAPIASVLEDLLGRKVTFLEDCIGDGVHQALKRFIPGRVTLLENLRFHAGEEANDLEFAQALQQAIRPDYIVQDGFGVVHRAHASTEAIDHLVPAVAGLLLENEVISLETAITHPHHPLVAIIGGAKISDKIELIEKFLSVADTILIGGAMANTFLKYQGHDIGRSIYEEGQEPHIKKIFQKAAKGQIVLPVDVAVATEIEPEAKRRDCSLGEVQKDDYILDLGFETMRLFNGYLKDAATVIWNGTLGYAELPQFAQCSAVLAQSLSDQHGSLVSIIGGGDTADFVLNWQIKHPDTHFSHISTGGGASLELMSGKNLPGIEALLDK